MKRITIIGGGIAGLSLGIALRRREVPVVIHESGTYPRHRVCGEFINGVSDATLENLGIADLLTSAKSLSTTAWTTANRVVYRSRLDTPAQGISRFQLDQRLAGRFQELNGELRTGSRLRPVPEPGHVWTTGRATDKSSRWIGIKVHLMDLPLVAELEMHLGSHGYVGLAPVEGNRTNLCGLFEQQRLPGRGVERLHAYLSANGMEQLRERIESVEHDPVSVTGVSAFRFGASPAQEQLCALGDSASIIPPFTGNGMSMAMEAAEIGIGPLAEYSRGRMDWADAVRAIRTRVARQFRTRLMVSRLIHPLFVSKPGRTLLGVGARCGMMPFGTLSRLLK